MRVEDTSAVVTGGASGLGGATARALAGRGAHVFALDLASAVEKAAPADGVTYVEADVTDPEQVRAAVDRAVACGMPLRVAVNCAGISSLTPVLAPQGSPDLALWRKVIDVNLTGTFTVTALAAEAIARTEPLHDGVRGVVVNTASIAAFDGLAGITAYAAAKAGVAGLTLPAARELAPRGIRVMTVAAGTFDTPMLPTGDERVRAAMAAEVPFPQRLGHPDEFARLVIDVIGNDYLNGEVIRVDGALRMAPR